MPEQPAASSRHALTEMAVPEKEPGLSGAQEGGSLGQAGALVTRVSLAREDELVRQLQRLEYEALSWLGLARAA